MVTYSHRLRWWTQRLPFLICPIVTTLNTYTDVEYVNHNNLSSPLYIVCKARIKSCRRRMQRWIRWVQSQTVTLSLHRQFLILISACLIHSVIATIAIITISTTTTTRTTTIVKALILQTTLGRIIRTYLVYWSELESITKWFANIMQVVKCLASSSLVILQISLKANQCGNI